MFNTKRSGERVYFTDFDGTVTLTDTTIAMVETCVGDGWEEINRRWENGESTTLETAQKTFELFRCTWQEIVANIQDIQIDKQFKFFVEQVEKRNEKLYIVSDGYEALIKQILNREGLEHLPVYANSFTIDKKGKFYMWAPYYNDSCGECGSCKTNVITEIASQYQNFPEIVYIGDGYSDRCAIEAADRVLAKEKLYNIAIEKQIPAEKINDFNQAIDKLF